MKNLIVFFILLLLFGCGSTHFAKRKYTKGIYIEKRSHAKAPKSKKTKQVYANNSAKVKSNKKKSKGQNTEIRQEIKNEKNLNHKNDPKGNNGMHPLASGDHIVDDPDVSNKSKELEDSETNIQTFPLETEEKNKSKEILFWVGFGMLSFFVVLFIIFSAVSLNIGGTSLILTIVATSLTFLTGSILTIISGKALHARSRL